jgi:hypothetical protein
VFDEQAEPTAAKQFPRPSHAFPFAVVQAALSCPLNGTLVQVPRLPVTPHDWQVPHVDVPQQ